MRFFNALLGALLFPMVDVLTRIIRIPLSTAYLLTASIHNAIGMYRTHGFVSAVAAIIVTLAALFVQLAWDVLILSGIYYLNPIVLGVIIGPVMIDGFIQGAIVGYSAVFAHCSWQLSIFFNDWDLRKLYEGRVVVSPFFQGISNYFRPQQPMEVLVLDRAEAFNALEINPNEWAHLKSTQAPLLNVDEISRLELMGELQAALGDYKNLKARLEIDGCPVLLERPEKTDTVLLIKEYQGEDGSWFLVPNSSFIFDKESLQQALSIHAEMIHPNTRDKILNPSAYASSPHAPTRYVWHPYYADADSVSGISQELSEQAIALRTYLAAPMTIPAAASSPMSTGMPSRTAQTRAARLAFFDRQAALLAATASAGDESLSPR